tara:strand:+ start:75 stop:1076 length:1002 start_codon:yes stop_codon:yes gene_type:complete
MSFNNEIIELDSSFIPYELRRNPIKMFINNNIYYTNNKFNYEFCNDKLCINNNVNKKIQYKKIEDIVIIHNQVWEHNYGHFILDNLLPIFKLICTYKNNLNPNCNLVLYLNRHSTKPLNNKWEKILKCFVSKIKYLNENIFFKKAIILYQSFEKPWKSKINNSVNNIEFFCNFREIVYKKININKNSNPQDINFLSRKNAKWRKVINEDSIKYNKISFEKISLKHEIEVINNTKILITPYGAGIVSGFFLNKNTTIIIIYPPNFSYTRDCSTREIDILNKLGIHVICCTNDCDIIETQIYENNITPKSNVKYRDKDFNINVKKLEQIVINQYK